MKSICKKLFVANILVIYIMTMVIAPFNEIFAYEVSEYKNGIDEFPESYKEALNELKKQHPNWNFVAVYTNLDFDYVVSQEMRDNVSLISKSAYSSEWRRDDNEIEPGWVNASEKAVRYFLDPRNFLDEEKIFQFESTKFNESAHTTDVIEKVLSGYSLANKNYYINNNTKVDMETKYSDVIYTAGKGNNVSPVHLTSRIIQETGGTIGSVKEDGSVLLDQNGNVAYYGTDGSIKTANRAINGSYGDFKGCYNFFNIGAYCTKSCGYCGNPFVHGLEKAKSSGWTTPTLAISAAADYLNRNWIKYGQDTLYFEKFDVNFVEGAVYLFGNQYMTNISAASTEASLIYKGYKEAGKLDSNFTFYIPVYDNMSENETTTDTNEKQVQVVGCEGSYLNLRSTPSTSGTIIGKLNNGTIMTQIEDNGTGWIKVRLTDGTEGYVSKEYVSEVKNIEVTEINLSKDKYTVSKGSKITVTPNIAPSNATDKSYTINSENEKIVKVENKSLVGVSEGSTKVTFKTPNGKQVTVTVEVIAKEDVKSTIDTNNLSVTDDKYITNIGVGTKLESIVNNITISSNLKLVTKDINGKTLENNSVVGTGTTVSVLENDKEIAKYTVLIRGDVNGDGKITSSDYVNIKNNIMGTISLNDVKKLGADVNKDGKVSSSDYVLIKNHIMGYSTITN